MSSSALDSISYETLYRRWEEGNWSASEIDFSGDRAGWDALSDIQRKSGLWVYSMFFYGEDSVAQNLAPYIDAAPREEQKYFLTTQQVDEARHAVFFQRFFDEVIGAGETISEGLSSTLPQLNWGYRQVFARLDGMADELRRDRSLPKFAQAIALYHLIVEAALAQPGQHFIEDYFVGSGAMPGFSAGMKHVSRDEERHIAFGVKVLSDCFHESEECKAAVAELLREVLPFSLGVFIPPGWDRRYTEEYGFTMEEIYAFGMSSVEAKLRTAGYPLDEMPPGVFPMDLTLPPEERATRLLKLVEAGLVGVPPGQAKPPSEEVQRIFFDAIARSADTQALNGDGATIQWRFPDAPPWHLRIDNGSTRAEPGETPDPDLAFEASWADWVDASIGGGDARVAMFKRKLRPRGAPRQLWRLRNVFPR